MWFLLPIAAAYSLDGARWWCEDLPLPLQPGSEQASSLAALGAAPWTAHRSGLSPGLMPPAAPQGHRPDGVSTVSLDDPDDVLGSGVLAATLLYRGGPSDSLDGLTLEGLVEADLVFNDEVLWDECPGYQRAWVAEHELGHVWGLGHSQDPDALMRAVTPQCTDVQGLADDDRAAIDQLYPPATMGEYQLFVDPTEGEAPLTASLEVLGQHAPDQVQWDFDDGQQGQGNPTTHLWRGDGDYTVSATATTDFCARGLQEQVTVQPGDGPDLPGDSDRPKDSATTDDSARDSDTPGSDKGCSTTRGPPRSSWIMLLGLLLSGLLSRRAPGR